MTEKEAEKLRGKLRKAIKDADVHLVRDLLSEGVKAEMPVEELFVWNRRELEMAYNANSPEIARELLKHGADPNTLLHESRFSMYAGPSILAKAVSDNNVDFVKVLLEDERTKVDFGGFKDGFSRRMMLGIDERPSPMDIAEKNESPEIIFLLKRARLDEKRRKTLENSDYARKQGESLMRRAEQMRLNARDLTRRADRMVDSAYDIIDEIRAFEANHLEMTKRLGTLDLPQKPEKAANDDEKTENEAGAQKAAPAKKDKGKFSM